MPDALFADLHLHTFYSDGSLSPSELMQSALRVGLSCIAITDHDTVEGLASAFSLKPKELELIAGIELSCDWKDREVHILGYFIDYQNQDLLKRLEAIRLQRIERIGLMVDKLKSLGIDVSTDEVLKLSGCGTVGRLHLAKLLLEKNIVSNIREAFVRFIAEGAPAYAGRFRLSLKEAINLLLDCGGVPVLAHPYTLSDDEIIKELVGYGLKGLEVYYPEYTSRHIKRYQTLADTYGLICTGGSDFHGQIKEGIKLGSVRIPYRIVEDLKKARDEISS